MSPTGIEVADPIKASWVVLCGVKQVQGLCGLVPVPDGPPLFHNGLPLTQPTPANGGDVLTCAGLALRLWVGTARPPLSALAQAEAFVGDFQLGLLSVEEGPGFLRARLRWGPPRSSSTLELFSRTALARSLLSLELILAPADGEDTVTVENVSRMAGELGADLLSKTEFVVPGPFSAPPGLRVRVSEPVALRFDGDLVGLPPAPLNGRVWLAAAPEGLCLTASFAPVPVLFTLGQGAFLSCEDGWGELTAIGRAGARLAIGENPIHASPKLLLPLLAGDEWLLSTRATALKPAAVHRLTVQPLSTEPSPALAAPRLAERAPEPEPLVFEGQAHRSVTFQLAAHDVVFTQGADGLFRGPRPGVFGVVGPGRIKRLRGNAQVDGPFAFYDLAGLQREEGEQKEPGELALLLPAPSGFLRGRTRLPTGPLTREVLAVFVDGLLEQGDGAAPALRGLLEARGDRQQADCFSRLLLRPINRRKLRPWLLAQGDALNRFEEVTRLTSFDHARYLLDDAIHCEPMLQRVREVHVDVTGQVGDGGKAEAWLGDLRRGAWSSSVRVVCWRDGRVLDPFAAKA